MLSTARALSTGPISALGAIEGDDPERREMARLLGKSFAWGWSKSKITATLAHMHRSGEKLRYSTVRRDSPALLSAAEAYFGSWGKALHAAGIDPNLYFVYRKWSVRP